MPSIIRSDALPEGRGSELERFSASLARSSRGDDVDPELIHAQAAEAGDDPAAAATFDEDRLSVATSREEGDASRTARASAGFATITEQMDRRSRESVAMVRLLEQNRQVLDAAESERDAAYSELARTVPVVQETAKQLAAALAATRAGESSADLESLFARNGDALADLEGTAVALSVHFLRCRTAWEQYARSVDDAERLRREGGGNP